MRTRPAHDVIALLARCAVGAVFLVHGWQKVEDGINATARDFTATGVPLAKAAAVYSTFAELLGGAALIAGLGLPLTGAVLFLDMAGAFAFVNLDQGMTGHDGFELPLVLAAASLLLATGAAGRLTADHALSVRRRRAAELAEDFPLPPEEPLPADPAAPPATVIPDATDEQHDREDGAPALPAPPPSHGPHDVLVVKNRPAQENEAK